ncbi:BTB/POZ domain-containing protein [Rhynchospora pubera]|uniref:BTB/POZ domain-containing protein n=1 Tax=Rhynchospora pubera TaxID=906938 RepID=A0AAV8F3X9_9POAL|nr:BTB/POZ domain-containing protein [Rhynchospora pubera]
MSDVKVRKLESGHTRIRNVPIAVTPEGFWCCPSPAVLQKSLKQSNHHLNKHKKPTSPKAPSLPPEISPIETQTEPVAQNPDPVTAPEPTPETQQRKISVGFGRAETSDLKVVLHGKEGIAVSISAHKEVIYENSSFFREKMGLDSRVTCIELSDCDDVEICVETIGLMYCKEVKSRLVKQSVPRVLRILKVAESLGFKACIISCLDYLEAVPWVGDEEEESVLSSIKTLQINANCRTTTADNSNNNSYDNNVYRASPLLRRVVSSDTTTPPTETLSYIMDMVLKSTDERARREMKTLVLKLLKENNLWVNGSVDICTETLYASCRVCLEALLVSFKQATEPNFADNSLEKKDAVYKKINLEADNILWLVEILCDRNAADDFVMIWAEQDELAQLHAVLSVTCRHVASRITARLFVGIGKGEILPSMQMKTALLNVWLKPLMDDYNWLQHGCRNFERKVVEEGIGRTILTLPLEEQRNILLAWLGSFLRAGDSCPNLQRAFEVWWRRTFVRPYVADRN